MNKSAIFSLLFALIFLPTVASAAGHMKPGLWAMNIKSDMMKNMPKIPPEQMEKMRQMGINIPQMQDGGMVMKMCITQEMAEREEPPAMHQNATGCQMKNFQHSGSNYSMDMVCDGKFMQGQGSAKGNFINSENFTSTYDFTGTSHGKPVTQHQDTVAKWLGADCGDVKPIELPKTK